MTTLHKAAQQALEALSEVDNCTYINDYGDAALDTAYESGMVYKAIAALRAALAQQEEPVAQYSDIVSDGGMEPRNKFDTLPAAQQVEGEPS